MSWPPSAFDAGPNLRKSSGMVHITRLTDALRRTLWKQGFVHPERLIHTRDERGDHVFTLVVPQGLCEYEPPVKGPTDRTAMLGASTGAFDAAKPGRAE